MRNFAFKFARSITSIAGSIRGISDGTGSYITDENDNRIEG